MIEEQKSDSLGDYYKTFSNCIVQFRLVRDKSMEAIDVSSAKTDDQWYDLGFIKRFFIKENVSTSSTTFSESVSVLLSEFDSIIELFEPNNYDNTKARIEATLALRGKLMFPGIFE